jgi:hypothetical protein
MKTTTKIQARLAPELRRRLRRACVDADITIQQAIEAALVAWLASREASS